jgi:hypothetical protein
VGSTFTIWLPLVAADDRQPTTDDRRPTTDNEETPYA